MKNGQPNTDAGPLLNPRTLRRANGRSEGRLRDRRSENRFRGGVKSQAKLFITHVPCHKATSTDERTTMSKRKMQEPITCKAMVAFGVNDLREEEVLARVLMHNAARRTANAASQDV